MLILPRRNSAFSSPIEYEYLGLVTDLEPSTNVFSFSLSSITQASNCVLVICFAAESDNGIVSFVDGASTYSWDQAASISFSTASGGSITNTAAIYSAEISSMPSTIDVTTTSGGNRSVIAVYAIRNYQDALKRDSATAGTEVSETTISATLNTDIQSGDVVIGIAQQGGATSSTWGGSLVENMDTNTAESGSTFTSAANYSSGLSVVGSVTFSSASDTSSLALASWR